jgi:hypothetical protein
MGHESAFSRLELLARNFQFRVGQQRSLNLELLRRISLDYHLNVEAVARSDNRVRGKGSSNRKVVDRHNRSQNLNILPKFSRTVAAQMPNVSCGNQTVGNPDRHRLRGQNHVPIDGGIPRRWLSLLSGLRPQVVWPAPTKPPLAALPQSSKVNIPGFEPTYPIGLAHVAYSPGAIRAATHNQKFPE